MNMIRMNEEYTQIKNFVLDVGADMIGSLIFAAGLICFMESANIAPGGTSSVALLINYVSGLPIGMLNLAVNIPLLILALLYLGRTFALKTIKSVFINTIMMDFVVAPFFPVYHGDRLLGSIYGGVLVGVGISLIFLRGSTTGGTDIVSFLVQKKFPHFSIGRAMMIVDGIIIGASILVYGDIDAGLFGVISLFCMTKVLDGILYGAERGSLVTVVSKKSRVIGQKIMDDLDRGVTYLKGEGGYSGENRDILICAVRRYQFARLKAIVHEADPKAFVIVTEAGQILGEGFKREEVK